MTPLEKIKSRKIPFANLLGIDIVSAELDRVVARMQVRDELCTGRSTVHGGAIMSLADTVGALATIANLHESQVTATIESKTNFVGPAPAGTTLIATATPVHRGRQTQVWTTRIETDGGRLVAVVTQTQIVIDGKG